MRIRIAMCVVASVINPLHAEASVLRVRIGATGTADGTSWKDAFPDLQPALAVAGAGDEIWVSAGTYYPAPAGDSVSSFVLESGVSLFGGFEGDEAARDERDWNLHVTVLSGDVGHDDVPGNLGTSNSGHVVVGSAVDESAVLDGFTIRAGAYGPVGTPAGDPLLFGSGIFVVNGSPTVVNCVVEDNLAAFGPGGGVYLYNSSASMAHCTFRNNHVHLGSGGAMYIGGASQPTIEDCTCSWNVVTAYSGQEGQGGAIQLASTLPVTVRRCTFDHNHADPFSAGVFEIPRGGAISSFSLGSSTTIQDCNFHHNSAAYGGAMFSWNTASIVNCTFDHNTAFTYAGSGGVSQGGEGAGYGCQWSTSTFMNCTIASNTGKESAGIVVFSHPSLGGVANVHNSIIWGNVATGEDVDLRDYGINGTFSAEYSCIQDLFTAPPGEDPIDPRNYPGCIVIDPQLLNAVAGDLHLDSDSPCIDAGQNSAVPANVLFDLDGAPRFHDDPRVADTGEGASPIVDFGAFEHHPLIIPGDTNGDGFVGIIDLLDVIGSWGLCQPAPAACPADINHDGVVGIVDLLLVIGNWG